MTSPAGPATPAQRDMRRYHRQRAWCEWGDFDNWLGRVSAELAHPQGAAWPPFQLLSLPGVTAAQHKACARRWMRQRLADSALARQDWWARRGGVRPRNAGQALRVGYLSADFHDHATAHLLVEAIEAHDRRRVRCHAYSHGHADDGAMRQRLRQAFDGFHDIAALSDEQAAQRIHDDGIDILVDLKGYTAGSRSVLLAWRAAPLSVSFLGYPGTLGGTLADYLITDRFVCPQADAADYDEALAYLPHSYQPHARHHATPARPDRATLGLPEDALVLCNFNQAWKLTPAVFDSWCRVLRQQPNSVLWLLHDEGAMGNLRQEALARGVLPQRLVFAPALGQAAHLARLPAADLVLDTWPYNAHTTASDALAAGVPLLTLAGSGFAARVAGSLLHAVGLPELVTHDSASYEALALELAAHPARLAALRRRLAQQAAAAPLFDVAGYTTRLEDLYHAMWARHRQGLPPAQLG